MPFLPSSAPVEVRLGNGIEVATGAGTVYLDPARETADSVVTHAHLDHLRAGALMTPVTLDVLRLRKPAARGVALRYGERVDVAGATVTLHDAGHVLGSAMVDVAGVLYTGDFNPSPGLTCGRAEPRPCDVLVTESTFGDPRFDLPKKDLVLGSVEAWTLRRLLAGPVALGAYQMGRAQELVALLNRAGKVPVVSPDIAAITAVYNAHGHDLAYAVAGTERARDIEAGHAAWIVPRQWLKKGSDFSRKIRAEGGSAAYLSGWCHVYSYFGAYDVDAQFALSDHAGFRELLAFIEACAPKRVLTTHGHTQVLAREVRRRLNLPASVVGLGPTTS